MPKIRASIISGRIKVSSTVSNHSSSTLSLPSIATFAKQFYGTPKQSPTSLQKHKYTPCSQQQLLKPNVDRFNTRGRTIYNCHSLEHQDHSSRLRLIHTFHRRNAYGKRKDLPKETLCLTSPDAAITRSYSFAGVAECSEWTSAVIETEGSDEKLPDDADILQQADRLFEMYIRIEEGI